MRGQRRTQRTRCALVACGALLLAPFSLSQAETAANAAKQPVVGPKPARLADGHPNWTGFWVPLNGLMEVNVGLGGFPGASTGTSSGAPSKPSMVPAFSQFSALKPPYDAQLAKVTRDAKAGKVSDPVATCFPPGMPRMMHMIYGMEFLQTPGQIAITSEWQAASRRIWLNQKTHTNPDELDPSYTGESIGHWEGDTLVVDTVGIRLDVPLNYMGLPHSDKLHVVEKFTETKPGILVDVVTVDDADAFVSPWTDTETYRYRPDLRIEEFVCLENNRNVGPHGEAVFDK